jgi:mono/diheme cytochrome c family protein
MNIKSLTLTGALLLPTAAFAQAADPVAGAALADKHCNQCHGSEVYTRAERRVTSRAGLSKQVRRWRSG